MQISLLSKIKFPTSEQLPTEMEIFSIIVENAGYGTSTLLCDSTFAVDTVNYRLPESCPNIG